MTKRCPTCGVTRSSEQFGRNRRTSDGLACYCRACTRDKNREQYLKNQERRKAEAREYRMRNAVTVREHDRERWTSRRERQSQYKKSRRAQIAATHRAWIEAHPGYYAEWRARNPGRIAYEKAWRAANWDRLLEQTRYRNRADPSNARRAKHKYRAAKAGNGHVAYTAEDLKAKVNYWGRRCWICSKPLLPGFHWDHVKPLNKGGPDMLANLRPACGPCNQSKRDRWPFTPSSRAA